MLGGLPWQATMSAATRQLLGRLLLGPFKAYAKAAEKHPCLVRSSACDCAGRKPGMHCELPFCALLRIGVCHYEDCKPVVLLLQVGIVTTVVKTSAADIFAQKVRAGRVVLSTSWRFMMLVYFAAFGMQVVEQRDQVCQCSVAFGLCSQPSPQPDLPGMLVMSGSHACCLWRAD